ncbi:phage protein Gp27 family protein [Variovorax boronicumulans]|uniref:phage protein Gp27 family protein n=1 Tax=Variovorax boronicumulans TaxID=436515 RepID=UPI001C5A3A2A
MGRQSSVKRLPSEIKSYIEAMLATGAQTLDELIKDLQARFPAEAEAGSLPSRSAIHRYGTKLDRRLAAIKASTEASLLIRQHAGDSQDARSEALTALVQTELFEAILNLQDAEDDELDAGERVGMLSAAAKNIATLTRSSVNLKKFQAEVEESTRKKLLEEQRAKLDALGSKGGVTAETKAAIREALGIL